MSNETDFDVWFKANMPTGDISVYRAVEIAYNLLRAQPQTPSSAEAITLLEAFVANAEKAGDTNSDDRWYRGNAQAWRQAAKLICPVIAALSDVRPEGKSQR